MSASTNLEREIGEYIDRLVRERDNAKSDAKQSESDAIRAIHERNEARHELAALRAVIESAAITESVPRSILKAARA